jgi:hypothetical protein
MFLRNISFLSMDYMTLYRRIQKSSERLSYPFISENYYLVRCIIMISFSWCGVRLCSIGKSATVWPVEPSSDDV